MTSELKITAIVPATDDPPTLGRCVDALRSGRRAPDELSRIEAAFADDPGLTALFGSYDDRPEAPGAVSGFRNLLHHHVHQGGAGPARTFWAGLGAVRRDAFVAAGGFDEGRYPVPSIEDIELGMRL